MDTDKIRQNVRERYGAIARANDEKKQEPAATSCCGPSVEVLETIQPASCCSPASESIKTPQPST